VFGLVAAMRLAAWSGEAQPPRPPKAAPGDPNAPLVTEGEVLTVAATASEGAMVIQQMAGFGTAWSKNAQLLWMPTKVGSTLGYPWLVGIPEDKTYLVTVAYTKAPDYGQVQLKINGAAVGPIFDGYGPQVAHAGQVNLGTVLIRKAPTWNQIQFAVVGKNPASAGYRVGIDLIRMTPLSSIRVKPIQKAIGPLLPIIPKK